MTLPTSFLDELRARTSLSALIAKTVSLKKAGREMKGCCPFHGEKTPSFYVNDDKGFYHCFGCSAHGDAIRWMTDQGGLTFIDAVKELALAAGLEMPARDDRAAERDAARDRLLEIVRRADGWFRDNLASGKGAAGADYLESRGLTADVVGEFGIGWAGSGDNALTRLMQHVDRQAMLDCGLLRLPPDAREDEPPFDFFRNRITFPIQDSRGRTIGFGARALGDAQPKYLNTPDTPLFDKGRSLYNIHRAAPAARRADRLIVVEGYMDAIALHRAGIGEAVAPNGTALTEAQLEIAWRLVDRPILSFDGDKAGIAAAGRAALRALPLLAPGKSLAFAFPPAGEDPDDVLRKRGPDGVRDLYGDTQPLIDVVWSTALAAKPVDTPEERAGLMTRLTDLVLSIRDRAVATEYAAELKRRYHAHWNSAGATRRPPPPRRARVNSAIEAAVLDGLVRYPEVARREAETLARVTWSSPARAALADAIGDLTRDQSAPTADMVAAQLARMEVDGEAAAIRASIALPFSFTVDAGGEQAREDLVDALYRMAG